MKNSFFKKIFASSTLSLIILFYISILVIPAITSAQNTASSTTGCVSTKDEYCLLEPIVVNGASQDRVNIASYLGEMFKIGIGLAGIFAVFMIVWGGFEYVSTDAITGKSAGKEKIEGALWGLGLALGSYLILNTINPELLKFSAGPEPIVVKRDLATRDRYTDQNLKLDQIRSDLNTCNEKERYLRAQGNIEEADALKLKCKIGVAMESVFVKIEGQDSRTSRTIVEAGKNGVSKYYDDAINALEVERQKAVDVDESTVARLEEEIGYLKAKKVIDLVKFDQEYDTVRALQAISSFGTNGASKIEKEVNELRAAIVKRGNDQYNKLLKTYPKEAESIRAYSAERTKKIGDAYKEGLDRLNSSINTASGPTIGG